MTKVREIRKQQQLTQEQLAERSGVAQDVISALETGRVRDPRWSTVSALATALDVRPEELFAPRATVQPAA